MQQMMMMQMLANQQAQNAAMISSAGVSHARHYFDDLILVIVKGLD
jgi:hypothetical protein